MPTIFVIVLLAGGVLLLGLARMAWKNPAARAARELTVLLAAAALWNLTAAWEHVAPTLEGKVLASKVSYFGILTLPVATLAATLVYCQVLPRLRSRIWVLYALAAVGIGLVLTNDLHGLHWRSLALEESSGITFLKIEHGPSFLLFNGLAQLEIASAFAIYAWTRRRRWNARHLLIYGAFLAPWLANLAYVLELGPFALLDPTPAGLALTGVFFSLSLFGLGRLLSFPLMAQRDVLNHISDLVLVFDAAHNLVSANDAARRAFDLPWLPLEADRQPADIESLQSLSALGDEESTQVSLHSGGQERAFEARSFALSLRWQPDEGRVIVLRDVTDERLRRLQLRQIVDLIPHPIFARDGSGEYLLVNEACAKVYGSDRADVEGSKLVELYQDEEELARMLAEDRRVIDSGEPLVVERDVVVGSQMRHFRTTKIAFPSRDLEAPAIAGLAIDITEQKAQVEELDRLASTDPLTGLANRRRFSDVLGAVVATARRRERSVALLYLDLDHFKTINDVHGHPVGDRVLVEVARRIESCIREGDAVMRFGSGDLQSVDAVSRLGGDEFVLVLPEIDGPKDAGAVARRLLSRVSEPLELDSESLRLRASIGISIFPEDADSASELLRRCDQALTNAKRSGKNRIEFFSAALGAEEERRNSVELALRSATERGELFLEYQPIWDGDSGMLSGGEALLRWKSSVLGSVSPGEFIPVAEQSGLIEELGLYACRSLCEQLVAWRRLGFEVPRMALNLSAVQILNPATAKSIEQVLKETGARGSWLEFEITEGSILSRDPVAEATLAKLRELGATLALDDFGTGYSSLSHLRSFRFERIKIDRSFVAGIGSEREDEELTRAIIALAQRMGMEIVGEGVESPEQLKFLQEEGCEHVQGFLLARPLATDRFAELLSSTRGDDDSMETAVAGG
ncbi:MAG: EAL domain-containing protein [Acidobacteriota bacterium]